MGRRLVAGLALAVACVALVLCGVMWREEEKVQTPEQVNDLQMVNSVFFLLSSTSEIRAVKNDVFLVNDFILSFSPE
jgi:hypothetical protein